MLVIGLTGGIGMGKSTAADILSGFGIPVYNADHAVHKLLGAGGAAVSPVARLLPEALKNGAIERKILGKLVFGQPELLKKLEGILHPLVRKVELEFLKQAKRDKIPAVVLEIPLLFETGAEKRCDVTICVTAPKTIQKMRVLKRKGMTTQRFEAIVERQMPDKEKCRLADFVVKTGVGRAGTKRQLVKIIEELEISD